MRERNISIILVLQVILFLSCTHALVLYSKPSIDTDRGWRSYEACGYRCKPMVDFFEGHGITIRIESFNYRKTFTIFSFFICDKNDVVTINPDKVYIKLDDGRELNAKGLRPGFSKEDVEILRKTSMDFLEFLRSSPALTGDLPLNMRYATEERLYRPISFFFDVTPPPHPSEEFELHIEGLIKNGQKIDVPVIKFGPAIRDSGDGIPLEGS
jgi:hypothetical protein